MAMHSGLRLGFSTLALFMSPPDTWVETAMSDGFNALEILCEGPMWPREKKWETLKNMGDKNVEIYMHSPTIDLNPASVNRGIREETLKQLIESIEMAVEINAKFVTTHPGIVHKPMPRIREFCEQAAMQVLGEAGDRARSAGVTLSIENMPNRETYLCTDPVTLAEFQKKCGCGVTIDVGHAITCPEPQRFLEIDGISYLHVNDNDGLKDQHLCPGDGILDLGMLRGHDRMIIELSDYQKVLRARDNIRNALL
ncbi:sugar phosphate isomerase/epimerase [Methanocella sp. CWC-04]|uniref:Sugar phosphate isomerase/epimerase n=1 Tax=Methanooceanicella nereidis TaxID=2052831 RepID=A0AAP2RD53_9EURY|nr:sugar phosphate isomerase/epimerase family protein [Methanocella sp. CWC-04]MCD1294077.1 sugar phosphate isomerase/epimerase [Methanocella sp. CWC-04]